jgi:hypothetical protein
MGVCPLDCVFNTEESDMQMKCSKKPIVFATFTILFLIMTVAWAQEDTTPKKRLRSPATVEGFIGGESHDSYVIRVRKGQVMTVQISWKPEGDNHASFTVSESPNFFTGEPIKFGKESDGGKRWTGKSPKTSEYYIYVVAHPTAQYTLGVKVE